MLKRFLHYIKMAVYQRVYPLLSVDNKNVGLAFASTKLQFGASGSPVQRSKIVSINDVDLEKSFYNEFPDSYVVVIDNAVIEPPYGFVYEPSGKLVCPSNWPMRLLLNGFPIKNYLSRSEQEPVQTIDEAFCLIGPGTFNYYHWVTDRVSCLKEYLEYKKRHNPDCKLLCPKDPHPAFYTYLEAFGITQAELIPWQHNCVLVKRLIFSPGSKSFASERINQPARLLWVRDAVLEMFSNELKNLKTNKRIFISRNDAGSDRARIANGDELERALESRGFDIVTLTGLTLLEQIQLFRSATLIVGLHGAGLTNILYCLAGTKILEITPTSHSARYFYDISNVCEHQHSIYAVEPNKDGDYQLDLNELLKNDLIAS